MRSTRTIRLSASILAAVLLAACTNDPIRYIPPQDRNALETQARLDTSPGQGQGISVEQMLSRAKSAPAAGPRQPDRLLIRFDGDSVQPAAAEQDRLRQFAARAQADATPVMVTSRPGDFDDPGSPVLGQRRAMAVSRELSEVMGDVQMRFDPALPPNVVVVTAGATRPTGPSGYQGP